MVAFTPHCFSFIYKLTVTVLEIIHSFGFFIVKLFFYFFSWTILLRPLNAGRKTVVTGSTDGIGREYAKQLAHRGINIVLISRTKSKLIEVANEIGKFFILHCFIYTIPMIITWSCAFLTINFFFDYNSQNHSTQWKPNILLRTLAMAKKSTMKLNNNSVAYRLAS